MRTLNINGQINFVKITCPVCGETTTIDISGGLNTKTVTCLNCGTTLIEVVA